MKLSKFSTRLFYSNLLSSFKFNFSSFMHAAVLTGPNNSLEIQKLKIPSPKQGEVLIKTKACGLCHSDLHLMKGEIPFYYPSVLGHEVSGEIIELGDPLNPRLKKGDKVIGTFILPCGTCNNCNEGHDDICETYYKFNRMKGVLYDGTTRLYKYEDNSPIHMFCMGGLAEYCVIPSLAVYKIPDSLPFSESCILGCAIFTAYGAIKNAAKLNVGENIAIIGAGGGVGLNAIQFAKVFGANKIIGIDSNDDKRENILNLGASHFINGKNEDVHKEILKLTNGRGVDVALEAIGKKETIKLAVDIIRDGGRACVVGITPSWEKLELDTAFFVRKQKSLIGAYGARARKDCPVIINLAEKGSIKITESVSKVFKLENVNQAYQDLNNGIIKGRGIIQFEN